MLDQHRYRRRRRCADALKVATTRPAASPAARSAIAGRPAPGCSAWKPRATGPICSGSNTEPARHARRTNRTKIDAFGLFTGQVGYAWNNALLYVKGGAAVTDNVRRLRHRLTGVVDRQRQRDPLGRHGRRRRRIRLRPELVGRRRIRSSVHGHARQHLHRRRRPGRPHRAPTASARTSTSSPSASTIAGAAR